MHKMAAQVAAAKRVQSDIVCVVIASDGARPGEPSEENVGLLTWTMPVDAGTYGPSTKYKA